MVPDHGERGRMADKMRVEIMELAEAREKTEFCGASL